MPVPRSTSSGTMRGRSMPLQKEGCNPLKSTPVLKEEELLMEEQLNEVASFQGSQRVNSEEKSVYESHVVRSSEENSESKAVTLAVKLSDEKEDIGASLLGSSRKEEKAEERMDRSGVLDESFLAKPDDVPKFVAKPCFKPDDIPNLEISNNSEMQFNLSEIAETVNVLEENGNDKLQDALFSSESSYLSQSIDDPFKQENPNYYDAKDNIVLNRGSRQQGNQHHQIPPGFLDESNIFSEKSYCGDELMGTYPTLSIADTDCITDWNEGNQSHQLQDEHNIVKSETTHPTPRQVVGDFQVGDYLVVAEPHRTTVSTTSHHSAKKQEQNPRYRSNARSSPMIVGHSRKAIAKSNGRKKYFDKNIKNNTIRNGEKRQEKITIRHGEEWIFILQYASTLPVKAFEIAKMGYQYVEVIYNEYHGGISKSKSNSSSTTEFDHNGSKFLPYVLPNILSHINKRGRYWFVEIDEIQKLSYAILEGAEGNLDVDKRMFWAAKLAQLGCRKQKNRTDKRLMGNVFGVLAFLLHVYFEFQPIENSFPFPFTEVKGITSYNTYDYRGLFDHSSREIIENLSPRSISEFSLHSTLRYALRKIKSRKREAGILISACETLFSMENSDPFGYFVNCDGQIWARNKKISELSAILRHLSFDINEFDELDVPDKDEQTPDNHEQRSFTTIDFDNTQYEQSEQRNRQYDQSAQKGECNASCRNNTNAGRNNVSFGPTHRHDHDHAIGEKSSRRNSMPRQEDHFDQLELTIGLTPIERCSMNGLDVEMDIETPTPIAHQKKQEDKDINRYLFGKKNIIREREKRRDYDAANGDPDYDANAEYIAKQYVAARDYVVESVNTLRTNFLKVSWDYYGEDIEKDSDHDDHDDDDDDHYNVNVKKRKGSRNLRGNIGAPENKSAKGSIELSKRREDLGNNPLIQLGNNPLIQQIEKNGKNLGGQNLGKNLGENQNAKKNPPIHDDSSTIAETNTGDDELFESRWLPSELIENISEESEEEEEEDSD